MKNERKEKILWMAQLAVLVAVTLLMGFTPLGYLKTGTISITFLMIPVAIGAILLGPAAGAILGALFGATSFAQCFGLDPFGTALLSINPYYTFILCMVPRILMGLLVGLIFKGLMKFAEKKILPYMVASTSAAVLNTVLFLGALILFFGNDPFVLGIFGSVKGILLLILSTNALLELIISLVVGSAIVKSLAVALGRVKTSPKQVTSREN